MGRPLSLDIEAMNLISGILERGLCDKDAYEAAGVPERTFKRWKAAGKTAERKRDRGQTLDGNESALLLFWHACKKGRAKGKAVLVGIVMDAAQAKQVPKAWVAAAWLLERQYPKEYGRKYIKIETGGDLGAVPGDAGEAGGIHVSVTIEGTGKPPEPPAGKAAP